MCVFTHTGKIQRTLGRHKIKIVLMNTVIDFAISFLPQMIKPPRLINSPWKLTLVQGVHTSHLGPIILKGRIYIPE